MDEKDTEIKDDSMDRVIALNEPGPLESDMADRVAPEKKES